MNNTARARPALALSPGIVQAARSVTLTLVVMASALGASGPVGPGTARAAEAARPPDDAVPPARYAVSPLGDAMDRLGWRLVSHLTATEGDANVLLSPWGLASVMAVLDLGTPRETKGMVTAAWAGHDETAETVLSQVGAMRDALGDVPAAGAGDGASAPGTEGGGAFADANGIWIAEPMAVSATVAEAADAALGVRVASVDFTDPATLADLNSWAAARTGGAIPALLARADPALQAVVANGVHYTAPWTHPFPPSQTHAGIFITETGERQRVRFMRGVFPDLLVARTDFYDRVDLPLAGGETRLRLTLPTDGHGLAEILAGGQALDVSTEVAVVDVTLPRFSLTAGGELTEALTASGLGLLFDGSGDFSNLAPGLTHFDSLSQRVRLRVDEAGLEAAAITVAASTRSMPRDADLALVFDRPFLVDIVHGPSSAVLLCGAVHRPGDGAPEDPRTDIANPPGAQTDVDAQ